MKRVSLTSQNIGAFHMVAQRGRYVVLCCEPVIGSHRECDSIVFLCFRDAASSDSAARKIEVMATAAELDGAVSQATVAVADPDLAHGDFGVDVFGDVTALPVWLAARMNHWNRFDKDMGPKGVCPTSLSDAVMAKLDGIGTYVTVPLAERGSGHKDYIAVIEDGVPLAIVNRNGMRWRNAIEAVLEAGLLGSCPRGVAERLNEMRLEKVAADYCPQPGEIAVVKAPRRSSGLAFGAAPTSEDTMERHRGLLTATGEVATNFPLPALNKDALRVVKQLSAIYQDKKAKDLLPASEAQTDFLRSLAFQCLSPYPFEGKLIGKQAAKRLISESIAYLEAGGGDSAINPFKIFTRARIRTTKPLRKKVQSSIDDSRKADTRVGGFAGNFVEVVALAFARAKEAASLTASAYVGRKEGLPCGFVHLITFDLNADVVKHLIDKGLTSGPFKNPHYIEGSALNRLPAQYVWIEAPLPLCAGANYDYEWDLCEAAAKSLTETLGVKVMVAGRPD